MYGAEGNEFMDNLQYVDYEIFEQNKEDIFEEEIKDEDPGVIPRLSMFSMYLKFPTTDIKQVNHF